MRNRLALAIALLMAASCSKAPPPDATWVAEIKTWRAQRLASLTRPDGWLTLVGLHWLEKGTQRVGSATDAEIFLDYKGLPPYLGILELTPDQRVFLNPAPGSGLLVDGKPATPCELATDRSGAPSQLSWGPLQMVVIQREERFALRVRNPASPVRLTFGGLTYFPMDGRFRVEGRLARYATPQTLEVPVTQGPPRRFLVPGVVHFTLQGQQLSLLPLLSSPEDRSYFFPFRDATSGRETYGGGRFLDAAAPSPGTDIVVLDFNRAYTPPCAFTPFATCPLPPPENTLPLAVRAGEKGAKGYLWKG